MRIIGGWKVVVEVDNVKKLVKSLLNEDISKKRSNAVRMMNRYSSKKKKGFS